MTTAQINIVKETWLSVAALDPVVVGNLFYNKLFEIAPELKPMFRGNQDEQSRKLLSMLNYVIRKLDSLEEILDEVAKLAQRHVKYGVEESHYATVAAALLWTLEQGLGEAWTVDVRQAWIICYATLSGAMIAASRYSATNV
ncbi:MAG: hemoglobin [Flaviaesturariibacter sp.]|nr:hemoglobin [Flaviaesturariibacter sp.]